MGNAWKFGHNVDTDIITPYEYAHKTNEEGIGLYNFHAFDPVRPNFSEEVKAGDVIVAGRNFGCGSSREAAARVFNYHSVQGVIAKSFARIFFRNAINRGVPVYVSEECHDGTEDGDSIQIKNGKILNKTKNESYEFEDHPKFVQKIIDCGGLKNYHDEIIVGDKS